MQKYGFGIDLGGTTIKMGLFELSGNLLEKWEIPTRTEKAGAYILDDIAEQVDKKLEEKKIAKEEVKGIGIGVPGPVKEDGTVIKCVNLGWGIFNVEQALAEKTGLFVKAGNDANVAALGEMWRGSGEGSEDVLLVTIGTGVGGGVVVGGKMLAGSNGAAGEIGHIKVDFELEEECSCGKSGCLEQFVSAKGFARVTEKMLKEDLSYETPLREIEHLTTKDIFDAAKQGDDFACERIENFGEMLGTAIANIACVLNPQVIVIGGGVSKAGNIVTDVLAKYFMKNSYHASRNAKIVLAKLGNDAGIYGCIRMISE